MAPVLAEGEEVTNVITQISGVITKFTHDITFIANPICGLIIVWNGLRLFFASDQSGMRTAKTSLLVAAVAMLLINLAGPITAFFESLGKMA